MDAPICWYLAGPMSGITDQNYPTFTAACVRLRDMGFQVVSPHEVKAYDGEPDEAMYQSLLRRDLGHMLAHCQGIILLPGWSRSKGARLELATAVVLGMPVRYFKDGLLFDFS